MIVKKPSESENSNNNNNNVGELFSLVKFNKKYPK